MNFNCPTTVELAAMFKVSNNSALSTNSKILNSQFYWVQGHYLKGKWYAYVQNASLSQLGCILTYSQQRLHTPVQFVSIAGAIVY